jgi:hypothetical protein
MRRAAGAAAAIGRSAYASFLKISSAANTRAACMSPTFYAATLLIDDESGSFNLNRFLEKSLRGC